MKFDGIQSNFTAGEVSPKLVGRVELERYKFGSAIVENMIVQAEGGLVRRGGSHFVAEVKDSSKTTRITSFSYSNTEAYVLEFGDQYLRIFHDHAAVMNGMAPYEITTAYLEDELSELWFYQDSDTLYITHNNHSPSFLTRVAHNNWTLRAIIFNGDAKWEPPSFDPGWQNPDSLFNINWESICWSSDLELFCVVASSGVDRRVMTSPDGVTWTLQETPADNDWQAVCWSPSLGLFCAVSNSGTGDRVMTSPDGVTWTSQTSAADIAWTDICWSPDLPLFCAIARDVSGDVIMTSSDGVTWALQTPAVNNIWTSVCWSSELSLFVAVSITGSGDRVMTSSDGVTWGSETTPDKYWTSICWSPDLSLFVVVSDVGTKVMTSSDASNWTLRETGVATETWESICWSPELALFYVVSNAGQKQVMTSPDGLTWALEVSSDPDNYWTSVCWSSELSMLVVVSRSGSGNSVMTKTYGSAPWSEGTLPSYEIWVPRISAADNEWRAICWSPELGLFCAVSSSGTGGRAMTSPDGTTWTLQASATDNDWMSVCWSPELGLFCAVSRSGTGDRVMTSPDGVDWTSRTSSVDNEWRAICWSPELHLFVAVSFSGSTDKVMTSPDGVDWTTQVTPADLTWVAVCWSPELAIFVATSFTSGGGGWGYSVMTSEDGVTWYERYTHYKEWTSVCWSPELAIFCAVAYSGIGYRAMTSPDGIDWTLQETPANYAWHSVCWSSELSVFIAVAFNGLETESIMSSEDGVTWVLQTAAADNNWHSVCWSPELSIFAAVAITGTGNSVMTTIGASGHTPGRYPALGWFYEQRHFFAASIIEPNKIWASQSADYTNLRLGTGLDNEGIEITIKAAYKFLWVSSGREILLGGSNAEFSLSSNALNEAITPGNIRPTLLTSYGSVSVCPIRIDDSVIYTQKGARKIRRLASNFQSGSYSDSYAARDITILSSHITKTGIINAAYSTLPDSIVWGYTEDGTLIGMTYEPDHQVYGWHRQLLAGILAKVKSVAVSKVVEGGTQDEVWTIVQRIIDGSSVQYIEYIAEGLSDEEGIEEAFFVDSGITQTGSAFTVVDGLDHLIGEEVQILADGVKQDSKTVDSSGEITLDTAVDKAHVGLQYTSTVETLPIEGGNPEGTSQTVTKRIVTVSLRLNRSLGIKLGDVHGNMDEYIFDSDELFTGDTDPTPFPGGYDRQSRIKITQENPLPFNLLAIAYEAKTR